MNDARFVAEVERSVPPGSKIYQLPYLRFPENFTLYKMADYDHFRAYLHSKNLRWSYGCMSGRYWDVWHREITGRPTPDMVDAMACEGFAGIYLDRYGYDDDAVKIENEIRSLLKIEPITSISNRYAFYSLAKYTPKKTGEIRLSNERMRIRFSK
jgi:phosphoglycerol transferase